MMITGICGTWAEVDGALRLGMPEPPAGLVLAHVEPTEDHAGVSGHLVWRDGEAWRWFWGYAAADEEPGGEQAYEVVGERLDAEEALTRALRWIVAHRSAEAGVGHMRTSHPDAVAGMELLANTIQLRLAVGGIRVLYTAERTTGRWEDRHIAAVAAYDSLETALAHCRAAAARDAAQPDPELSEEDGPWYGVGIVVHRPALPPQLLPFAEPKAG